MNIRADRTLAWAAMCSAVSIVLPKTEGTDSLSLCPRIVSPKDFQEIGFSAPTGCCEQQTRRVVWSETQSFERIDHAELDQERSMRCPKCEADKWYEVATHDPWSGRPLIACKICGEYAEPEALKREDAHDVIARVLAADLIGEGQADARAIASKILRALENAGLTISRS